MVLERLPRYVELQCRVHLYSRRYVKVGVFQVFLTVPYCIPRLFIFFQPSTRVRLRLNSIQVWVSVPDMTLALREEMDTGPEYRTIYDIIALNISKMIVTNASDSSSKGFTPVQPNTGPGSSSRDDDHSSKLKVEFASVSAFVIPAHGESTD